MDEDVFIFDRDNMGKAFSCAFVRFFSLNTS